MAAAREHGVSARGHVRRRRQNQLVGRDADVLDALAVAHYHVGVRDAHRPEGDDVNARLVRVVRALHDRARRAVAYDRGALLQLHQAREDFGGGRRLAVYDDDDLPLVGPVAARLGRLRVLSKI